MPKNIFVFKINGEDIYSLIKEEVDYDPTKTESLKLDFKINDQTEWAISGITPWIIDEVEDKIQIALGIDNLTSLQIENLDSKSWVANEFLDMLCSYDIPEQGLEKLTFYDFSKQCEPFEEEVVTRLANICPRLCHLKLSWIRRLTEAGRLSIVSLFRQIIQHNPPIEVLNLESFSY